VEFVVIAALEEQSGGGVCTLRSPFAARKILACRRLQACQTWKLRMSFN